MLSLCSIANGCRIADVFKQSGGQACVEALHKKRSGSLAAISRILGDLHFATETCIYTYILGYWGYMGIIWW